MSSEVSPAIAEAAEEAASGLGITVYHAELSGGTLRIQVDRPGGISLAACTQYSRALSMALVRTGAPGAGLPLEVSSPGVERRLYRPRDYAAAVNRRIRVNTKGGQLEGVLVRADPGGIVLNCAPGGEDTKTELKYESIREARLVVPDADLFRGTGRIKAATAGAICTDASATGLKGTDE